MTLRGALTMTTGEVLATIEGRKTQMRVPDFVPATATKLAHGLKFTVGERYWIREPFIEYVRRRAEGHSAIAYGGVSGHTRPDLARRHDCKMHVYQAEAMTRINSRLTIEIVFVAPSWLGSMSAEDAIAEGIKPFDLGTNLSGFVTPDDRFGMTMEPDPVAAFRRHWREKHRPAPAGENPRVIALTFKIDPSSACVAVKPLIPAGVTG